MVGIESTRLRKLVRAIFFEYFRRDLQESLPQRFLGIYPFGFGRRASSRNTFSSLPRILSGGLGGQEGVW